MKCGWDFCNKDIIDTNESNDNIKAHVDAHIKDITVFKCMWDGCPRNGELFSNKYALQAHMRIHTGDRPFKCQECQKDFSRADALNKHMKRHGMEEENIEMLTSKYFYICEMRAEEERRTIDLLEERQFKIDSIRILNDEILMNMKNVDGSVKYNKSWNEY